MDLLNKSLERNNLRRYVLLLFHWFRFFINMVEWRLCKEKGVTVATQVTRPGTMSAGIITRPLLWLDLSQALIASLSFACILKNKLKYLFGSIFWGQSLVIKLYIIYYILKINIITYFENLTVKLHVPYTFNTHVKFCVNQTLFTILSISLYLIYT